MVDPWVLLIVVSVGGMLLVQWLSGDLGFGEGEEDDY